MRAGTYNLKTISSMSGTSQGSMSHSLAQMTFWRAQETYESMPNSAELSLYVARSSLTDKILRTSDIQPLPIQHRLPVRSSIRP